MNSKLLIGLALGGATLLSGCEHVMGEPANAMKFGEPNRVTMMAQVVDPDPQYDEPMAGSGSSAAQAIDRYNKDAVKKPERVSSTQAKGGGGGGN
jgi:hypothetical protein